MKSPETTTAKKMIWKPITHTNASQRLDAAPLDKLNFSVKYKIVWRIAHNPHFQVEFAPSHITVMQFQI